MAHCRRRALAASWWRPLAAFGAAFFGTAFFFATARLAGFAAFFFAGFLEAFFIDFLADFLAAALPAGFFLAFFAGFLRAMTRILSRLVSWRSSGARGFLDSLALSNVISIGYAERGHASQSACDRSIRNKSESKGHLSQMAISQDEQKPATEPQASPATPVRTGNKQVMKTTSPWGHDEDADPPEYARLLDLYDNSFRNLAEGEVVKGTVLKVTANEVVIDVGYKSEGVIAVDEFLDETGQVIVREGDVVDVLLERTEDREGHIVLSREKAEKMKIWDEVERAFAERKVVIGRVVERIKGGLAVDIGVRAFLPGSQIDVRPVRNLDALKGQELRMRVIKVNKKRGNIVLSRKVLLEEENAEKKKSTLETLAEGKVLRGVVKNITDYGAFIDLGGIDGLLHITDMSWGRVGHPSELFKVNDEIDVVVLKYDQATERVSLGHKQLMADPWTTVMDRFPAGVRVSGKVVSLTDYGAFIELEPGVEGLIHVSEMSWSKRVKHPSKILNVGDSVEAQVLGVDPAARRISLGLKQVESNPWHELAEKYPVGTRIKGKVRNLTEFGAFVEVEDDIDGLIHISRHVVEQARQASERSPEEGRRGRGDGAQHRRREPAPVAGAEAAGDRYLGRLLLAAQGRRQHRGQGRAHDQLRRVRRARRRHRGADSRQRVRRFAGRGEDRPRGREELPDEDHQAQPGGAEDRLEHPRAEERRVPDRLGVVFDVAGRRRRDAGRSPEAQIGT